MLTASILLGASFLFALALTPLVRALAIRLGAIDQPGERKIHTESIPRLGGLGVVLSAGFACVVAYAAEWSFMEGRSFNPGAWTPILVGGLLVLFVGVWDDLRPTPSWVKFLFQALAAGLAIGFGVGIEKISWFGGKPLELGWLSYPLTFLWIVGLTNAFNLVDGLDGLAAGLASIGAGTCAAIFLLREDVNDAMLLIVLLGALLGFLRYNFNPATIFLGDSGSLVVGYVLAVTAITGSQKGATTLAVAIPLLVFGLPIADTVLSMVRRFMGGLRAECTGEMPLSRGLIRTTRMFQADQRHIHHRLMDLGFSHRKAVLTLYAFGFGLSCLALMLVLARYRNLGFILIVVGLATYIGIHKLGYEEVKFLRSGTLLRWYDQLTFSRRFFLAFADIVFIAIAYWGTFFLKYGMFWKQDILSWYADVFPLVVMVQLMVFWICGLYRGVWRATGIGDLIRIGLAVGAAASLSFSMAVVSRPPAGVTAFFCINLLVLGALLIGSRSGYRILDHLRQRSGMVVGTAIIYGAGRGGQLVLKELLQNEKIGLRPLGFLDDDPRLKGRTLDRVPVLGSSDDLSAVVDERRVAALIVASDKISGERLDRVCQICNERNMRVFRGRVHIEPLELEGQGKSAPANAIDYEGRPTGADLSRAAPEMPVHPRL